MINSNLSNASASVTTVTVIGFILILLMPQSSKSDKCSCGPVTQGQRIVNGEEATPHEFPWIISMMDGSGYWYCGGSILNEE